MARAGWRAILVGVWLVAITICVSAAGTWAAPTNVSESAPDTTAGALAVDSQGRVLYAWSESGDIWYRTRKDASWSAATKLRSGTAPALAADGQGAIHLAFLAPVSRDQDVYYASWKAATGWTTPDGIVEHELSPGEPAIAAGADGQVAVIWREAGEAAVLYAAQSEDGALWTVAPVPDAAGTAPSAAFDAQGDLYVSWEEPILDGEPHEIWVNILEEGSWVGAEDVSIAFEVDSTAPALALGPDGMYVAWQEDVAGDPSILVSMQNGVGWEIPRVASDLDPARTPRLAFDAVGKGHLAWTSGGELWHRTWSPAGDVWQASQLIVGEQASLGLAGLCADGAIQVGWLAEAAEGNRDLFSSSLTVAMTETHSVYVPLALNR